MFKGPQGMLLAGNTAAAAAAAAAAVVTVASCYCSIKILKCSQRTDRFRKIDINHPQTTFRYMAENLV